MTSANLLLLLCTKGPKANIIILLHSTLLLQCKWPNKAKMSGCYIFNRPMYNNKLRLLANC